MFCLIVTILMASIPEGKCTLKSVLIPDSVNIHYCNDNTKNGGKMLMPLSLST